MKAKAEMRLKNKASRVKNDTNVCIKSSNIWPKTPHGYWSAGHVLNKDLR